MLVYGPTADALQQSWNDDLAVINIEQLARLNPTREHDSSRDGNSYNGPIPNEGKHRGDRSTGGEMIYAQVVDGYGGVEEDGIVSLDKIGLQKVNPEPLQKQPLMGTQTLSSSAVVSADEVCMSPLVISGKL